MLMYFSLVSCLLPVGENKTKFVIFSGIPSIILINGKMMYATDACSLSLLAIRRNVNPRRLA